MDTLSPSQRHTNMSHIRSTGNSLETELRSQLFRFGFRFRKNDRRLAGSPDIVFSHYHAVIFINGCFWHAHGWNGKKPQSIDDENPMNDSDDKNSAADNTMEEIPHVVTCKRTADSNLMSQQTKTNTPIICTKFRFPKSNTDFWYRKFQRNTERDSRDIQKLLEQGWRVGVVWECSITGKKRREKVYDVAARISLWLEEEFSEPLKEF